MEYFWRNRRKYLIGFRCNFKTGFYLKTTLIKITEKILFYILSSEKSINWNGLGGNTEVKGSYTWVTLNPDWYIKDEKGGGDRKGNPYLLNIENHTR